LQEKQKIEKLKTDSIMKIEETEKFQIELKKLVNNLETSSNMEKILL